MTKRILVAAPRMWPWCDDGSLRLMHWAESLVRNGYRVTVVTPRWDHSWPATAVCREVNVVRLLPAPRTSWNQLHFLRTLGRWLANHRREFDLIYVDEPLGMLHQLTQGRGADKLPVLGRFQVSALQQSLAYSDPGALQQAAEACRKLDLVVAPDAVSHRQLKAAGIVESKIMRIPDIAWYAVQRDAALRRVALQAFAKISSDLIVPPSTRLVIVPSAIERRMGLLELCRAIGRMLDRGLSIRTWLIGTGSYQRPLYDMLRDMSWHREILMQGSFDTMDELLQVADLCVLPSPASAQFYQPMTLASQTAMLMSDTPERRSLMGEQDELFFNGTEDSLQERLDRWYRSPSANLAAVHEGSHHFHEMANKERVVAQWIQAIEQLAP